MDKEENKNEQRKGEDRERRKEGGRYVEGEVRGRVTEREQHDDKTFLAELWAAAKIFARRNCGACRCLPVQHVFSRGEGGGVGGEEGRGEGRG
jgi:hypothetical protein